MSLEVVDMETIPEEIMTLEEAEPSEPIPVAAEEEVQSNDVLSSKAPVAPKRKGRPPGSKSKEPGKPRAKRKAVTIVEEPVATDTIRIEDDTLPRALERSQPIPRFSHDETSAMLLQLLSHQAHQRRRSKVELWQSWFR